MTVPDRWVAAAVVGAWTLAAALLWGEVRRATLLALTLSLQIGLALYLTTPPPVPSVGTSWPNSLAAPLASLTALAALVTRPARPWVWGGGLAACTALLAATTLLSLPGSPERLIGLAHLVLIGAYYVVLLAAANCIDSPDDLDLVVRALMVSLAAQSLIYFVQTLLGATFTPAGEWIPSQDALGRYGGTVGVRPAMFSSFLLPLLLVAVAQLLTSSDRRVWIRYGLPAALGSAALILTFTRASWTALALGLGYLVVAARRRRWLLSGRMRGLATVLLLLGIVLSPKILARVAENHGSAFEERWRLVQMALRVIAAHPATGVGAGAYPYMFREYLTPELADKWLYVVHNVYILRAAETGLPGAAAWLAFLVAAFRRASPERATHPLACRLALGWRAGLLALGWEMLWDVSLGPAANSLLWFLCGLTVARSQR
jgi:O-antigen ligase